MIAVVFRKRKNSKPQLVVYTPESRMKLDTIIDSAKRKPPIPHNWYLDEIGVGESFIEKYKEKYKISKVFYDKVF
jgi:hypothetical protein